MKRIEMMMSASVLASIGAQAQPEDFTMARDLIVCWGDSLSTSAAYPARLQALFPQRPVYAQAVGGEGAEGILGRMFGQVMLPPRNEGEGTDRVVRLRTRRHVIPRLDMENYRPQWPRSQLALYDPIERVEFYADGRIVAQADTPIRLAARTDLRQSPTRVFCPAHGLREGDHVWFETDGRLPAVMENARTDTQGTRYPSRHYYVRNPDKDSFEVSEFPVTAATQANPPPVLMLGSDAEGEFHAVPGYEAEWHCGATRVDPKSIRLHPVFARNRATHILWIGANSIPDDTGSRYGGVSRVPFLQAHTRRAFEYLSAFTDRILVMTVLNGSYPARSPDSRSHRDAIELNHWILKTWPDNAVDIVARLHAERGPHEPQPPELRAMQDGDGNPILEADGSERMAWIGSGYTPLQFRPPGDRIHLNLEGNHLIGDVLAAELRRRGW